jgi:hypothetical protein
MKKQAYKIVKCQGGWVVGPFELWHYTRKDALKWCEDKGFKVIK